MAAPAPTPAPTHHQNVFFSAQQLSEVLGGAWIVAEGASPQRNAFASAPEAACTDALRIIYKREDANTDAPTAAIVHNVLISQHHNGARTMFLAITDKIKNLPAGSITPISLFPGLHPLMGPETPIDGRWVDPATAMGLATYEFIRTEDQVKQIWVFLSSMGKNTCHQYIVDAEERMDYARKLIQATTHLN
eukprot:Phypoly_transcript_20209.p1 GENE.Phypoly_transcript_20209~~Phypoly_transcript_20209.p1  ORF type:complete len:214 (+),score=32.72 Phypoly_transcript_20209:70-642(+)